MNRFIDALCRLFETLLVILLALMVILVFGNVVLRYALNSGIAVSEEVSRWLFVWMVFLGAVVALKEHGHLGTDMAEWLENASRASKIPVMRFMT